MPHKQKYIFSAKSEDLRSLAEERLKQQRSSSGISALGSSTSQEEMLRLIHELRVHQVELEMQLEKILDKYTELYDFAPVGYLTLSRETTVLKANLTSSKLLGIDRALLLGMQFKRFVLPENYQAIDTMLETVFSQRIPGNCEVKLLPYASQPNTDHSNRTFRMEVAESDTEYACCVVLSDITEQKRVKSDLIECQNRFNQALEAASAGVWEWNLKNNELFWSDELWHLSGLKKGEEKPTFKLLENSIHPDDRELVISYVNATAKNVLELNFEYRLLYPDGSVHWNMSRGRPLQNEQGLVDRYIGTVIDITERKQTEEAFDKHKERFKALFDNHTSIMLVIDPVTRNIVDANHAASEFYGWSIEKLQLMKAEQISIASLDNLQDDLTKIRTSELKRLIRKHKRADGSIRDVEITTNSIVIDGKELIYAVINDISDRKFAEKLILESNERFSSLFTNMLDGIAYCRIIFEEGHPVDFIYELVNPRFEKLTGLKHVEGKRVSEVIPGIHQIQPELLEIYGRVATTGQPERFEIHFLPLMIWLEISVYSPQNDHFVAVFENISERKQAEIALKKMSIAVEQSPAIVVITDIMGNIEYVNPQFTIQTGYTIKEVAGKNPRILKSGLMPESLYENLWNTILAGNIWRGELQNKKKNCELYWERVSISAIRNAEGTIINFVAVKEDISEHKKKEELIVEGRAKLQAALASMSDAVFISDTRGNFIHYNDAFATFHRFKNKEECARTFDEYPQFLEVYSLSGELVPAENWAVPRALRGETGTGVEFRLLRKDSGETWVGSYNYAPICDKEGLIVGSVVTGRDISKSKASEAKIKDYVKQLENAMQDTLQAVANVVEAHDPYTAGHERRVGIISADIAREMGWSQEKCNTLNLIGLVHDIGKMSIPDELLSKQGRLSAIEFQLVKTHAEEGYEILKDVEFPLPIAEIIREHHERMDGSGYPHGLKGEEALIESRILAVADVLEAIASHRPYRPSLGIDAAISEIESQRGSLFDPEVVDAMLRLFREKAYQLPD